MSGIGLVLNIAKDALLSQQYAIDVVSHNIANVSTEGYSRQIPRFEANQSAPYAGLVFGRGVNVDDIVNVTNEFVEKRLQSAICDLSMTSEKEKFMSILESMFNESSNTSISSQFSEFWNAMNDLNNNPSGLSERGILTEYGEILSKSFQESSDDLLKLNTELNNSINEGVEKVNQLIDQIADTNSQILLVRITGNPNDLLDKRGALVKELSGYIDINAYEYEDGSLTVSTSKGFVLVNRKDSYHLGFDGTDIIWDNTSTPITENVQGGKLGAWLDLRDEVIPKYKADLDELAKSTIWEINKIHSQGVGLTGFTSLTGSYKATDRSVAMGTEDSGLDFYDRITDGSFKLWSYDQNGDVVGETTISIDADATTLDELSLTIAALPGFNSSILGGSLNIEIDQTSNPGYTFAFSDDSSNILAALGLNTFFKASDARNMGINENILADKNYIAAGKISSNIGPAVASSSNDPLTTGFITTSGNPGGYTGTDDGIFTIEITGANTFDWYKDGGVLNGSGTITPPPLGTSISLAEGVSIIFNDGGFNTGDTFTIDVTASSDTYGDFFPGDNTNSLDMANLEYQNVTVRQWTYSRENGATYVDITTATLDENLHQMVGSIGIESQSIQRENAFNQSVQEQMSETRDNISGVSLDEEMANLIRFQHAYMAAAKLITTAQQMLDEILKAV